MNETILNLDELRKIWLSEEQIAQIHGWDFSHIEGRYREHPLPWSYGEIIGKHLTPSAKLLDIGFQHSGERTETPHQFMGNFIGIPSRNGKKQNEL